MRKLIKWIRRLLKSDSIQTPKQKARQIVEIVERLKKAVDSKEVEALINIIPGEWDNSLVISLRYIFGAILKAVGVSKSSTPHIAVEEAIKVMQGLNKPERNSKYKQIATGMLLTETTISERIADEMVEKEYQKLKSELQMQNSFHI